MKRSGRTQWVVREVFGNQFPGVQEKTPILIVAQVAAETAARRLLKDAQRALGRRR